MIGFRGQLFAVDRLDELTGQARSMVAEGRGREFILMPGWWYVITAESFLDRIATVPDTVALAPRIKCPVLTLRGDKEDRDRYPVEDFHARAGGPCQAEIIPDCDHFYNGREDVICARVSGWLARTLSLPAYS